MKHFVVVTNPDDLIDGHMVKLPQKGSLTQHPRSLI
jgi:hypothetical protein